MSHHERDRLPPAPGQAQQESQDNEPTSAGRRFGWWRQGTRLARYRLVIPLLRSRHPPEHTARGVAIGLFWAMTPLVGIQMMLVLATWIVGRRLFSYHFSLVLGLAWTWVTNAFTILPMYYAYHVTGQVMLGHWDDLTGFDAFAALWRETFAADIGFWRALADYTVDLVKGWGVPLLVGCLPWAIVSAAAGYWISLRVSRRRAAIRAARAASSDERRARRSVEQPAAD